MAYGYFTCIRKALCKILIIRAFIKGSLSDCKRWQMKRRKDANYTVLCSLLENGGFSIVSFLCRIVMGNSTMKYISLACFLIPPHVKI